VTFHRACTAFYRTVVAVALPVVLYGCGGGGGAPGIGADARSPAGSGATRSVRLNNYNNWWLEPDNPADADRVLEIVGRRDNVVLPERWIGVGPADIKAINAAAKVYRVYTLMCKNTYDPDWNNPSDTSALSLPIPRATIDKNDWWLRDGDGNIAKEQWFQWYVDVGKPGYREAYLAAALDRTAGKGFDGFVFDYWSYKISGDSLPGSWFATHPMPAAYPSDDDWYQKAWKPFIEYVMTGLHKAGCRIIGNCAGEYGYTNQMNELQRSLVDGVIYEQWAVDWPQNGSGWLPGSTVERRINSFSTDPLEAWTADFGLDGNDPEYEQKQVAGLAMYYIALPASQDRRSYHHHKTDRVFWERIWDLDIGTPAERAVKLPGKYFWSRRFTDGIVLLNCEASESISFTLDKQYHDLSGGSFSGLVTLEPHSALVLASH